MPRRKIQPPAIVRPLLTWYDRHRRRLPWRALPGETPDPYRVWLSEIMLQQTTVPVVGPYFERFVRQWPSVRDLAAAGVDDVTRLWAGLGYYARARNLHACARAVVERHGGRFPDQEAALRELPGIGPYTAAAVAAIAFDRQATAVNSNIERVVARLFRVETPLPRAKAELRRLAATLTPLERCGDYTQALMDLGSAVCAPRSPKCAVCPIAEMCAGHRAGMAADLPRRAAKAERPRRHGVAFWAISDDDVVLLRRRAPRGLLGGMMEIPTTAWRAAPWSRREAVAAAPSRAKWRALPGVVRHGFTHLELELIVYAARLRKSAAAGIWYPVDRLGDAGLPGLMRKVARHALAQG